MGEWLVSRVLPNAENAVTERLAKIQTESYVPQYRERIVDRRTHRRRWTTRCLFPCYVFVRTQLFYWLLDVKGIVSVVMDGDECARSRGLDRAIDLLRASEEGGFVPKPVVEKGFRTGSRVRVCSGVFKDRVGVVSTHTDEKVLVTMTLFGREVNTTYSEQDLAAA